MVQATNSLDKNHQTYRTRPSASPIATDSGFCPSGPETHLKKRVSASLPAPLTTPASAFAQNLGHLAFVRSSSRLGPGMRKRCLMGRNLSDTSMVRPHPMYLYTPPPPKNTNNKTKYGKKHHSHGGQKTEVGGQLHRWWQIDHAGRTASSTFKVGTTWNAL